MSNKNNEKNENYLLHGSIEINDRANILYSDDEKVIPRKKKKEEEPLKLNLSYRKNISKNTDDDLFWQEPIVELKNKKKRKFEKTKSETPNIGLKMVRNAVKVLLDVKTEAEKYDILNDFMTNAEIPLLEEPSLINSLIVGALIGEETDENLQMAYKEQYLNTPYALQHTIYKDVNFVSPFLRQFVIDKIKSQLGVDAVYKIGGIFFDSDSDASRKLAKHPQLQNFIKNNKNELKNYGFIEKSSISFQDINWKNAVGKADIVDIYLDKNGEITFYVIDTYDFNKDSRVTEVRAGRHHQEKGTLIPYFMIYSVKIDKEDVERLLK